MDNATRQIFARYAALLEARNASINLVSRRSGLHDMWERHFADSLSLLPYVSEPAVDVGSGAGFPALPLAIMGAPVDACVEEDKRKAEFLREVAALYNLKIEVLQARAEDVRREFPLIIGRAFAPLGKFLELTSGMRGAGTRYALLKGARVMEEIAAAEKSWRFDYELHGKTGGYILTLSGASPRK